MNVRPLAIIFSFEAKPRHSLKFRQMYNWTA
uniref:Uncharacterized protein n=1 Tax=Rhizophora mucronata TaxID=61149 RepID=A0A2P2PDL7_RHIMU